MSDQNKRVHTGDQKPRDLREINEIEKAKQEQRRREAKEENRQKKNE